MNCVFCGNFIATKSDKVILSVSSERVRLELLYHKDCFNYATYGSPINLHTIELRQERAEMAGFSKN